jgi:hypothetical protein
VYCAILIGAASGSGVSYEGGINPIHKFGGRKGDGIRNCRLTVTSVGELTIVDGDYFRSVGNW